jgi:methylmalonyl-CoA mutase
MDSNENKKNLFEEFPPVTTEAWEQLIQSDLKGADYEKKLVWKTDEGFDVRPYYREENLQDLGYLESMPGEFPFVRGNRTTRNNWSIRQDFLNADLEEANRLALDAIDRGVNAVGFNVKEITTHKQMNRLLKDIDLQKTSIHFISSKSYPLTLELFIYETGHRQLSGAPINGSINFDPIGYLLLKGNFYVSEMNNFDETEYLLNTAQKKLPMFRIINVNGQHFRNAGSTIVQELAFGISCGNEYLSRMTGKGFTVDQVAPWIQFTFGTGSNYFMEIAKLRAARLLWAKVVDQYGPANAGSREMFIHAVTLARNKTIYDPYVNMLRTTTEGMASAIGNADSVSILPFDSTFRNPDDFSLRIARNQQLILKEEAHLDKNIDPSAGSYYIEKLTDSIACHAWDLFREVEGKGGMIESIKAGFVQDETGKAKQRRDADIAQRKTVSIGTNQYPNLEETMSEKMEVPVKTKTTPQAEGYKVLSLARETEEFEELRLRTEEYVKQGNRKPSVFLLQMGNLAMRKARAGFATNFFGCAGFGIIDNAGYATVDEATDAAVKSGAQIIVICSSDEEYAQIAPEIAKSIRAQRPQAILVVAGYPKEILDTLKAAGVGDFIHMRSNLLDTLKQYQDKLGIINK